LSSHATDGLYIVEPDTHRPYHCTRYQSIVYQVMEWLKPKGYVNLGDFVDWWQLSTYDKDPRRVDFIEDDLALFSSHLDSVGRLLPVDGVLHILEGNHEDRLRRFIWANARALAGIVPDVPRLLRFPERNAASDQRITWHPVANYKSCKIGDTIFHHGHYFDKHTAVNNLTRYRGCNLIHGHTHRVQYAENGDNFMATLGHGSDEAATAHRPTPTDWCRALGLYTVYKGRGSLEICTMRRGSIQMSVRGRVFQG
jgi:predicted phosphodiesterase